MPTGVAENLDHQVRATIDHGRDGDEVRPGLDEAPQFDHADDAIQITVQSRGHLGQQVDAAQARALHGLFLGHVHADRALEPARGVVRQLTRDVQQVAGADVADVVGHGLCGFGQDDAEVGETGVGTHGRKLR